MAKELLIKGKLPIIFRFCLLRAEAVVRASEEAEAGGDVANMGVPPLLDLLKLHQVENHGPGFYVCGEIGGGDAIVNTPVQPLIEGVTKVLAWDGTSVNGLPVQVLFPP